MAGATARAPAARAPGGVAKPGDEDLVGLWCRRPVFEGVLRGAVAREAGVVLRAGVAVEGLLAGPGDPGDRRPAGRRRADPRRAGRGGRRGRRRRAPGAPGRLAGGRRARPPLEEHEATNMVYFGRYFRLRPGARVPDGPSAPPLAGDAGYLGYMAVDGDGRTFALTLVAPAWDRELRVLRHAPAFMAAARPPPGAGAVGGGRGARPLGPVAAMGQLRNVLRRFVVGGAPVALGLHVIGDALCHTTPVLGRGASLALTHAFALADVLAAHPADPRAQALALDARVWEEARACYRDCVDVDRSRTRAWRGEAAGPAGPAVGAAEDDWPRFVREVLRPAAAADPAVFRALWRAQHLADPPDALRRDGALLARARAAVAAHPPAPPPPVPSRAELLAAARAALGTPGALAPVRPVAVRSGGAPVRRGAPVPAGA